MNTTAQVVAVVMLIAREDDVCVCVCGVRGSMCVCCCVTEEWL